MDLPRRLSPPQASSSFPRAVRHTNSARIHGENGAGLLLQHLQLFFNWCRNSCSSRIASEVFHYQGAVGSRA